ncbi:hypothetical protein J4218_06030 [Candidatus Pacearchaeota archaeon]|nr:hypothetical protein [Candidatus Pacearchaeota archaeon]
MEERGHILNVLKEVKASLKKKDYVKIKNLSNEVVHSSSIDQDPDVISVAVIIYSLSKLIERENYKEYKGWPKFYSDYIEGIENLIKSLEKNDINNFRKNIDFIRNNINKLSGNLKIYLSEVFRKARINKASRIYEHGISMEQTARVLGISVWELAEYAGQTGIADVNFVVTMPIKQRIKIAEEVFEK